MLILGSDLYPNKNVKEIKNNVSLWRIRFSTEL